MVKSLMKIHITLLIFLANPTAGQSVKKQQGPHNGQLEAMQHYMVELVLAYKTVTIYLYDEKLKPYSNKNVKCEMSLFYPDDINIRVRLRRFEVNGFITEVGGTGFNGCLVFFEINGKDMSVKFQNEYIVEKNIQEKKK